MSCGKGARYGHKYTSPCLQLGRSGGLKVSAAVTRQRTGSFGAPSAMPPVMIKTNRPYEPDTQCVTFQLPPINITCEVPIKKPKRDPKVCCVPIVVYDDEKDVQKNRRALRSATNCP